MALANVACLLAKWQKKVLIVDFDLEAPGIERFFAQTGLNGSRAELPGLLELVLARSKNGSLDWRDCVLEARPFKGGSPISIISAGRETTSYAEKVQKLDWNVLFENHGLGTYLNRLRNEWRSEFDFVLIDSRTGISDIGGICTIILPDVLVLLFTANAISVEGVADVMRRASAAQETLPEERPRLMALPVISRDDRRTEYKQSNKWRARIADSMRDYYEEWVWKDVTAEDVLQKLYLPQVSYWSFGERLPVVEEPEELDDPSTLGAAYARLATLIANDLDWGAMQSFADPHELVEERLKSTILKTSLESERADKERTRRKLRNVTIVAMIVTIVAASIPASIYLLRDSVFLQSSVSLQRQAYSTAEPPILRIQALKELFRRGDVTLPGIDLSRSELSGLSLERANFRSGIFARSGLERVNLRNSILVGAIFVEAKLTYADLERADLGRADLGRADLREANLVGANLREANLREANLREANLREAKLEGADLRGANLREAKLEGADLRGADLRGVKLRKDQLMGTRRDEKTRGF